MSVAISLDGPVEDEDQTNVCGCSKDWGWHQCLAKRPAIARDSLGEVNPNPSCRQMICTNPFMNFDYYVGFSQSFVDPYSLDHFSVGVLLYLVLLWAMDIEEMIAPEKDVPDNFIVLLIISEAIHAIWVIMQNTPKFMAKNTETSNVENDILGYSVCNSFGAQIVFTAGWFAGFGIDYSLLSDQSYTQIWKRTLVLIGFAVGLQLVSELFFETGIITTTLRLIGCGEGKNALLSPRSNEKLRKRTESDGKTKAEVKRGPVNVDDKKEESDDEQNWMEEAVDDIANGFKFIGEKTLNFLKNRFAQDVFLGEQAILAVTEHMNVSRHVQTCVPGVYSFNGIHDDMQQVVNMHIFNELGILTRTAPATEFYHKFDGHERSLENFKKIFDYNVEALCMGNEFPSFPDKMDFAQLKKIVSVNPFCTMFMSYEDGMVCLHTCRHSTNPFAAEVFGYLPDHFACMKLVISPDFKECYFENEEGKKITEDGNDEFELAATKFITCICYAFEYAHAVLHVYAYVMLGCAQNATSGTPMQGFMNQYSQKVFLKYVEVAKLLLNDNGLVVGSYWPADHNKAIMGACDCFKRYSKATNAQDWFKNVFCSGIPEIYDNQNILPQVRPYVQMLENLAQESCHNIPKEELGRIDAALIKYFSETAGPDAAEGHFKMKSFNSWIQCQSMMGILHGNTLTLSRLIFTPWNHADGNWDTKIFQEGDANTFGVVAGTLMGLEKHHAINQVKMIAGTNFEGMMERYQEKTDELQKEYWEALEEDEMQLFGWILSVYGPNMNNNSQLTITTYV